MATRIRTLNFLPEIFKTPTNSQFLNATLDQIVDQPNTKKIEGYVGSKIGYGVNAKNYYVTEPTKIRTDYQLDPGVTFLKKDTSTAQDFISYPGIIDGLELEGAVVNDNNRLFTSQFYSWDSFTNLDKIINFTQYYWIPEGPQAVTVSTEVVYNVTDYIVTDQPNGYLITPDGQQQGSINPSLTLLRGGTYRFSVNQNSQFWIQGVPGVTGFDPAQLNMQTRAVFGVENNGTEQGVVVFTVPFPNAQDEYLDIPGNNYVDLVTTEAFDDINGVLVSDLPSGVDGVTPLEGLTIMFYDPNSVNPTTGFVSKFYDTTLYDEDGGAPYTPPGDSTDFTNYDGGYYTDLFATYYTITYEGDPSDPVIRLVNSGTIPVGQKITASYGTEWVSRSFYRSESDIITLIPYLSAPLNTLYYQDGTSGNKVGQLRLIASNSTNRIDVLTDIIGEKTYTSPNGVVFTNGLKVIFSGEIYPAEYENNEYYVEGVGTAIELIPVTTLVAPEPFTANAYIPYDTTAYDMASYDSNLYIPVRPDYITIARNSIDKNAWSRSNRWFHIDVINATAEYTKNPALATLYATQANKAKRPIIEFYPNLRLFNAGILSKAPVDFFDKRTTDAFNDVTGVTAQQNYYPDVEVYTGYNAVVNANPTADIGELIIGQTYEIATVGTTDFIALGAETNTVGTDFVATSTGLFLSGSFVIGNSYTIVSVGTTNFTLIGAASNTVGVTFTATGAGIGTGTATQGNGTVVGLTYTTVQVPASSVVGAFQVGQYINDSTNVLPRNSQISAIDGTTTLTLTVTWRGAQTLISDSGASLIANDSPNDGFAVFDGARIVFSVDTQADVRNKIYVVRFSTLADGATPVITLTEAENGLVLADEQTVALKGYNYQGMNFYFDGNNWITGQQKTDINQPPLFDIFDENNISFGNSEFYVGTSFAGNKLFAYGLGSGLDDPILGFPLLYSSVDNVGDISFDVSLNSATFDYVKGTTPYTQKVNTGYVFNYSDLTTTIRQLGWQTAIAPSVQYQVFEFDYYRSNPTTTYTCDIAKLADEDSAWPTIQLFVNNNIQPPSDYIVVTTDSQTIITFTVPDPLVDTVVEIFLLSDQVSPTAYYTIPVNLNNNPLNADITTVNVGDIRGQYQSSFYNHPNTTGNVFGANNYRDLGNMVPYGNTIIQNSASLVLPGAFLRKQNHNLFNALLYNSREYITFKTLLVDTVNKTDYNVYMTPASMLDDALDQITKSKTDSNSFFWSDMLPSKAAYITNTYSFANALDVSIYPLSKVYNFATANYNGVLVYLTNTSGKTIQLIRNVDYTVSTDAPSLTVTLDLAPGDLITIKEYNQTYGSYVPNTPTKLGLYPSTIPAVVLDDNYAQPTYFIIGHDGSYNKLYGDYIDGYLIDFRDQVLLEYETRIYNNLKLSNVIPIQEYEVMPGFFRDTGYSYDEILSIYSSSFLNWVGQNRINYKKQLYNSVNEYTYNYNQSGNKINQEVIPQGYWRGIYEYFYDTSEPDTSPWQMLGYTNMPSWWTTRYGPAPYTSDNLVLWNDLADGIDWNDGNPVVIPSAVRPELLQVLPVDSAGNLVSPFVAIVGNYSNTSFNRDWKVGDVGPAEFSYRRSSSWPFDLMRILALTKPAAFFNLGVDVDNYKYNEEFNQYLFNNRSHLVISNIEIYGNGIAKTSYINWIVDFEKQVGIDATTNITDLLDNLDVRLVYRLAGFSDKNLLKFYVEKSTANSNNSSLLIPDESYQVLLYDNQPFDRIIYSGVVVQITNEGYYKVYGNSQTNAYFNVLLPKINGNYERVSVQSLSVLLAKDYYETPTLVAYGTEFYSVQEVAQFLDSYGRYLASQGVLFEQIESGLTVNWRQMVAEYLYWAQSGWEPGSIVNINPASDLISINKDSYIVQPLTLQRQNFVLNQNLYPIQSVDLSIVRDGTLFTAQPLNQGDTIAYGQFNISNFEHGIVFDNVTLFNDIIYNLTTGLRQNRISVRGTKTAEWNGTVDAQGFILNQDNIQEWSKEIKYTTGSIVKYKNKYWIAITIIQAKEIFDERDWKETDYNEIQKGLLPNTSTRSYESTLYYDVNQANLENDADLLSFSLIGYRPRDYLALADLTDITQINVYKNFIKNKGTLNAASAFKGATLAQGGIDYDIYENWAIKSGEFGGVLNSNFIDFKLNQKYLTGNPSIVGLTNGIATDGVQQEVPLYNLFNYGRPVTSVNVLPLQPVDTPTQLFPDSGYANFDDMRIAAYYYYNLPTSTAPSGVVTPISKLYVGHYVWIADYQGTWNVMTPVSLGQVIFAKNNLNGTVTLVFNTPHNLIKYQPFAVVNFNEVLNGYYVANIIVDPYSILVNVTLSPSITTITGQGIGFQFQSQRVENPSDIINLPLLNTEFVKNKVWVDTNNDGQWAVYRKSINYSYDSEFVRTGSETFGSAVAYTDTLGYLVGDADAGVVYRYYFNQLFESYELVQTITNTASFGSTIAYTNDTFVISQPTGTPRVYVYKLIINVLIDKLVPLSSAIIDPTPPEPWAPYYLEAPAGVVEWGKSVAISGDANWIYISALTASDSLVYVYRLSEVTNEYEQSYIIDMGLAASDNFGHSLATDYYGDTVVIGTPNQDYTEEIDNWGYTYVYDRTVQNIEAQYTSLAYIPETYTLAWAPSLTPAISITNTDSATDYLTCANSSDLTVDTPIVFTGTVFGGVSLNTVYYIKDVTFPYDGTFTISTSRGGSTFQLNNASGIMNLILQDNPIYVNVNGTAIADNMYFTVGTSFSIIAGLTAGDIINVSSNNFVLSQTLTTQVTPRIGVQFGKSVDTTSYASEIIVGAPFELNSINQEGAVYRYTNGGGKYGMIIGTTNCAITTDRNILINGYLVVLPSGNATTAATIINNARITNVQATASNGKLIISLIDTSLAYANDKLNITALETVTWSELGFNTFTQTQVINDPHTQGTTQFGNIVKFNEFSSFVVGAPTATRYEATTFDSSDDENYDNDTLFDNNATQWVDTYRNAGAMYMFDYLSVYNESLTNCGNFVYAQSVNAINETYGSQPMYGYAVEFNASHIVIGTPDFKPDTVAGQIITYINTTGETDWSVYRSSNPVVDSNRIQDIQLYSALTNNTLDNLDYIDPLQGKILGSVRQNIDVVSNVDPAGYNSPLSTKGAMVWGSTQVGQIWFNTSTTRFVNYHQNDIVYNSKWWGQVFPGSNVTVYSWITSDVLPINYAGPGTPFNVDAYAIEYKLNAVGVLTPVYFYWVRNTNIVFTKTGKTLADSIIQSYIASPINSGISFFAPLQQDIYALYNCADNINANDTVLHIGFSTGTNDDVSHSVYNLIRTNYADDFLPGLPNTTSIDVPESLYDRMLDSLCGLDEAGGVVPDPYLPKPVQYGILARPRQSFFINRYLAVKNYLTYANEILAQFPIAETRRSLFLNTVGVTNLSTDPTYNTDPTSPYYSVNPWTGSIIPFYNTTDYWTYINWWATGYDDNTKSALQVPIYADLATIVASPGLIVTVTTNGDGKSETYVYTNLNTWERIGVQDGTIEFSLALWDYAEARLGFGDNFFDTTPYDSYPAQETRSIIRALNEEIYTNELLIYRNKSLILLFEFIQSETIESQNYLPWLNKTSFIDVAHTIRELKPIEVFQSDNQDFLSGYINEIKPYHVVIKEFLFKYTGIDVYPGNITDFDLPAQYNTSIEQFITPELVYANPSGDNQFLPTDDIWQTAPYVNWYNHYGLSLTGVKGYNMTILASYITLNSSAIAVDNAYGFPINGTILIGAELIGYSIVDRSTNTLSGITRGLNGTEIAYHLPGEDIYMDLPAVLLLDGGRGYLEPPQITAYIDTSIYPEPTRPAVLEAVMNIDSILSITVIDPGDGYAVLPDIIIDPSVSLSFTSGDVNLLTESISLPSPLLQTGDLVKYLVGANTEAVGGLTPNQYYYVNVVESTPTFNIGLYTSYRDAINDTNRIILLDKGTGNNNSFNLCARASCISTSVPIRENQIALRFDRTTYDSQVTNWQPGSFYGSYYAGIYNNSAQVASSAIQLESTRPPINNILASSAGAVFEIETVENDQVISWSSTTRNVLRTISIGNIITLVESEDSAPPDSHQDLGPTIGFYVNMPIKFQGAIAGTNLLAETIYYVKEILSNDSITISATIGGPEFVVGSVVISSAGLLLYVGEVTNTAVVTLFYPGILTATSTSSVDNSVTVPMVGAGQGGTTDFYTDLVVYFTGEVFGGVVENEPYYVTTVINTESFTISKTDNPLIINATTTRSVNNSIVCSGTIGLSINDPIIFNNMIVGGETVGSFGNILSGYTYYVNSILDSLTFQISTVVNGIPFVLSDETGTFDGTDQKNIVQLTTGAGSMTCTVGFPVSPGQVSGQQFTFYPTDFTNYEVSGTNGHLVMRIITDASSTSNYLSVTIDGADATLSNMSGGTNDMYVNMPIKLAEDFGGLTADTTYWVSATGIVTTEVTATTAGNYLICASTDGFYNDMPIIFTGSAMGGIVLDTIYYVIGSSITPTSFKVSIVPDTLIEFDLVADSGSIMVATGTAYIQVSDSLGGSTFALTDDAGAVDMIQSPTTTPVFSVRWILGGYTAYIENPGEGYTINNTIQILGTQLDGLNPTNNLTLLVDEIDSTGQILSVIRSGAPSGVATQYYLKTISASQCEVYSDPLLQVPVSGIDFPYTGVTETTAYETLGSTDSILMTSIDNLFEDDPIVFMGDVLGGIVAGQIYYINSLSTYVVDPELTIYSITIKETINGPIFEVTNDTGFEMRVAKPGDYAFLPEPFYFNQSIVKYNNRVYQCVVSNNDSEFIFGKWELLSSDNRTLNALDRIIGYYQPTVNMPGLDLTQLVDGITYPNSTYLGNAFQPSQQLTLDTDLQDKPFNSVAETIYDVQGDPFTAGYGPEELVPGVVSDNLTMIVTTRPGTNWVAEMYQHVGYNVVSKEYTPVGSQQTFSFDQLVQTPAQVSVFRINNITGLATRLYAPASYTVNWVAKTVRLNSTLPAGNKLIIDVYEVGNGDQLEKSSSHTDPIRLNSDTGFNEIYLNCNYSAILDSGSGVIRPDTGPITIVALETNGTYNTIICESVSDFVVNQQIVFQGDVFGGVVAGTHYYIKTISVATLEITISEFSILGVSGATFELTSDSGIMDIVLQAGSGTPWADPIVLHNGNRLVFGNTYRINQTISTGNVIVCNTTSGMSVNDPITFSDTIFCPQINAQTTYYIKTIIDDAADNKFTISASLGGPTLTLTNAVGGAIGITHDYAIGIVGNTTYAKIIFAAQYDDAVDYLVYSVFGETYPLQYGYTLPETELFTGNGSTVTFTLENYVSDDNPNNAVVEVNGLRLINTVQYTINDVTNQITFVTAPANGSVIAVTSYNFTARQYFNTQYGITNKSVLNIANINNEITTPLASTYITDTTSGTNILTCISTTGFLVDQTVIFKGLSFGNVATNGTVYYIKSILSPTTFTISATLGGSTLVVTTDSGNVLTYVGGQPAVRVTTSTAHGITAPVGGNALYRINGTNGSVQLNDNAYYVHVISATEVDLYTEPYLSTLGAINYPVTTISGYTSGGYIWKNDSFIIVNYWDQFNVDRLWVTINGYRVPSSLLVLNADNNLSILAPIVTTDKVIITSMMPSATPDQLVYIQNVNKNGVGTVYRANTETRTWLVQPLLYTDETIYLSDVTRVSDVEIQNVTAPAAVDGIISIGLMADKRTISQVIVRNVTTSTTVNPANYYVELIDASPVLQITAGVTAGNNLIITTLEGNLVYINGEQIIYSTVDLEANTLSGLERGANGTGEREYSPTYTEVYGILSNNLLPNPNYYLTWNSDIYNPIVGDPLQISETESAYFLNTDIS